MSLRPVRFNADGSIDVWHEERQHGGTITAATMASAYFTPPGAASPDHRYVVLPCPVAGCGSSQLHPVGGGAAPAAVQELFVRLAARLGCPCGQLTAGKPIPIVQAHVKLETERMDGAGQWSAGTLH